MTVRTSTGRPLRAMSLLALGLGTALMLRLPILQADVAATEAVLRAAGRPLGDDIASAIPRQSPPPRLALTSPPPAHPIYAFAALLPDTRSPRGARFIAPASPAAPLFAAVSPPDALPAAAVPAVPPALPAATTAVDLATRAYARLAAGDRRAAAALFDAALASNPDPRAPQWQADRDNLHRRWSGDAYALFRKGALGNPGAAASPILGGGQYGANLAWTVDPLARQPIAIFGRLNAAHDPERPGAIAGATTQAALGLRWKPVPAVTLAAERLIALGADAADQWSLRAAAGAGGSRGRIDYSVYAEADVLGSGDSFAGVQARAGTRVAALGAITLSAAAGTWASLQTDLDTRGTTIGRLDIGPSLVAKVPIGRINLEIAADWRFRIAGNAAPDSGPAITVSTSF